MATSNCLNAENRINRLSLGAVTLLLGFAFMAAAPSAMAQDQPRSLLEEPVLKKVSTAERAAFRRDFSRTQWTGAGFEASTVLDRIPTREIRARLQKVFGDPTQKLRHLVEQDGFRPGQYIQFEYWFVIDDTMPLMILDIDGPFGNGLVFAADSRFVDLMPEVKRTLTRKLMQIEELGEYEDHYFELDSSQWYLVSYSNGTFSSEKVNRPAVLK